MNNSTAIRAASGITIFFVSSSMDTLDIEEATNRLIPYGGLQKTIARFMVSMMPNVTGCMPTPVQIGNSMGVRIIVAGILSINMPTMKDYTTEMTAAVGVKKPE